MRTVLALLFVFVLGKDTELYNFTANNAANDWYVVNDGVMGGISQSRFTINAEGHGVFKGSVSIENNGGFASVQHRFAPIEVKPKNKVRIRLKGDGKNYQFRIKGSLQDYYSYIYTFETTGDWQEVVIPLKDMYPSFRGRRLDAPNFDRNSIAQLTFLIANKRNEDFQLLLDRINLD